MPGVLRPHPSTGFCNRVQEQSASGGAPSFCSQSARGRCMMASGPGMTISGASSAAPWPRPACRRRLPRPLRPHGRRLPPALAGNRDDAARAAHPICFGGPCSRRFGFGLPAERRAVAPHGEQDHRQTPGHGDTGAVHAAPLGEAQPPALQRRRAPGAGEKRVGGLEQQTLPIRLTPMTATCRVPPLSRVKLGIGWSRGVARDAEQ